MPLQFIDNQPIRFNSAKFDDQACINKDLSAYAMLVQPDDPICFQMKQACCDVNLACDPNELGAELVTNGNFAVDSDWTKGAGWTIGSGIATYTTGSTPATAILSQAIASTVGAMYRVTVDMAVNDSLGTISVTLGDTIAGVMTNPGSYTFYVTPKCTGNIDFYVYNVLTSSTAPTTSPTMSIDNVSVRQIATCYTFDTSDLEEVVNGTFTGSASGWNLGTGWSYSANTIIGVPAATTEAAQGLIVLRNRQCYTWTFDLTVSAGSIDAIFGNVNLGTFNTAGTKTITHSMPNYASGTYGKRELVFLKDAAFNGSIDNVSFQITDSGWTYTPEEGFCHVTGWANAFYAGTTLSIGTFYKMSLQVSMTTGSLLVEAGGVVLGTILEAGNYDFFFTSLTTDGEKFTPSQEFDGCIFPTVDICPQLTEDQIELRLVYENGAGATDYHTNLSATNPVVYNDDWITWCIGSLDDILSGGIQVELPYSCFRMQIRYLDCSGTPVQITSDTLINYKEEHSCTKRIRAWSDYIADGFNFGDDGNIFKLIQRFRTLYFNPTYPTTGEDYKHWTGTKKRTYSEREKHYELLFDYMDEYAHDTMSIMIVSDIFEIDGAEYNVPFKDYEPDWADRGKRNLAQSRLDITKRIEGVLFNRNCR